MFDKEAVEALRQAEEISQVRESISSAITMEHGLVAAPDNFTIHDVEKHMEHRRRARGVMNTSKLAAFSSYTKEHAEDGATVFVDSDNLCAVAVLNLGNPKKAGQCDNVAKLSPKMTAAYQSLLKVAQGNHLSQTVVAEFFEDWTGFAKFYKDEGDVPASKAIAALRKITIDAMRKLESSENQLSASKSTFENIQATSTEPLPTTIYFTCVPYNDLTERTFVLRLSVLTSGDKPSVTLRIVKKEEHDEEMASELAEKIKDAFTTFDSNAIPVLLGTYTKSN
ncbi:Protein of unkown function DUF2303 [uncultured Caudovirales phage]|uniref:Protein of unkown function DUF2303 n=1 Tax=uncultured Caudovirales phage TaxID=2100421 RepID=A0A6J5KMX6_9CAUD|nr:Protein of unkown function DUF2303 [uncultured Caudovirales phage]